MPQTCCYTVCEIFVLKNRDARQMGESNSRSIQLLKNICSVRLASCQNTPVWLFDTSRSESQISHGFYRNVMLLQPERFVQSTFFPVTSPEIDRLQKLFSQWVICEKFANTVGLVVKSPIKPEPFPDWIFFRKAAKFHPGLNHSNRRIGSLATRYGGKRLILCNTTFWFIVNITMHVSGCRGFLTLIFHTVV